MHKLCDKGSIFQWNDECEQAFIRLKDVLTSPGRQHNNADALSRRPCKVCLRHQERNTEEKSEPECATTLEQVRVTTGSKQPGGVLGCSGRVSGFCTTSGTHRVTIATNSAISH